MKDFVRKYELLIHIAITAFTAYLFGFFIGLIVGIITVFTTKYISDH